MLLNGIALMVEEAKAIALAKFHIETYILDCELTSVEEVERAADILGFMVHNFLEALDNPETMIIHSRRNKETTH